MTGVSVVISPLLSGWRDFDFRSFRCFVHLTHGTSCGTRGESHFKQLSLHSSLTRGAGCERDALSLRRPGAPLIKGLIVRRVHEKPKEKKQAADGSKLFHPRFSAFDLVTSCIERESGLMLTALRLNGGIRLR